MDDDRTLLDRAAKAAGLWDWREECIDIPWSPLINSGDALELAVRLGIDVRPLPRINETHTYSAAGFIGEPWGSDPLAATRRAIVRAAASMEDGK